MINNVSIVALQSHNRAWLCQHIHTIGSLIYTEKPSDKPLDEPQLKSNESHAGIFNL